MGLTRNLDETLIPARREVESIRRAGLEIDTDPVAEGLARSGHRFAVLRIDDRAAEDRMIVGSVQTAVTTAPG